MQGVHAEINKFFTKSVHNYIVSSRAVQGQHEMMESTPEEREDVVKRWNNVKFDLKNFYAMKRKEKVAGKLPADSLPTSGGADSTFDRPRTGWLHTRKLSFDERKKLHAEKETWKRGYVDVTIPPPTASDSSSIQTSLSEDAELERAIRASVLETSRGNAEEDAMIEAAVRESVKAVRQKVESEQAPPLPLKDPSIFQDEDYQITDEEYQALIEQAIQQSLVADAQLPQESGFVELDVDTAVSRPAPLAQPQPQPPNDEDAELQRAIEASKNPPPLPPRDNDDEELERAIAASKEAMAKEASQRTEEDIVMEYVKKQSLAEEEYRQQMMKGKGKADEEDEDEELRRAMEESLKMSKGDYSGPSGA
jgi:hypothetical protein